MPGMGWQALLGALATILAGYLLLLGVLWGYARRHPELIGLREAARLPADIARLVRRLAADPAIARGVRIRLGLLLVYLVSPIDLVPDFLPVIGYADDALLVAMVLRSAVRSAGPAALARHWPGTSEGLHVVRQLAGLPKIP
jgi:uncharacterized membrane protein YkvA (DUF1232 family)